MINDFFLVGLGAKGFALPGKLSDIKVILNGGQRVTFLRPDGYFSLYPTTFVSCTVVQFMIFLTYLGYIV